MTIYLDNQADSPMVGGGREGALTPSPPDHNAVWIGDRAMTDSPSTGEVWSESTLAPNVGPHLLQSKPANAVLVAALAASHAARKARWDTERRVPA